MSLIDDSPPQAIVDAIDHVSKTPKLRTKPGLEALMRLFHAPNHSLRTASLTKEFPTLNAHFGWLCKRVAERLGEGNPDRFALVDYSTDDEGAQVLTLKPAVVTAMRVYPV